MSDSSYNTITAVFDEVIRYARSRVEHLTPIIRKEKNQEMLCYYIGQETAFKEIIGVFDSSEHSTKEDVRCLVEQRQKNRTDIVKASQLGFEVPEK